MRLARFILEHLEPILADWESFARTLGPAADAMSRGELRDHARMILQDIAADIETRQTDRESVLKSKGLDPGPTAHDSPAAIHGTLRQTSGFTLLQLTSEYRALRASVLRLWLATPGALDADTSPEMLRFNEAIDQAVSESVVTYAKQGARTRELFLAMLGHDLRSPLQSLSHAGDALLRPEVGKERRVQLGQRVRKSVATMNAMVNDLLEYARLELGGSMPVDRVDSDLAALCRSAIEDAEAAHPSWTFTLAADGDLRASVDPRRLQQVLANLLNNAAQYGDPAHPITLRAFGDAEDVVVAIGNRGPVLPATTFESIFQPLVQLPVADGDSARPATSVGLGLFIARAITEAHGGTLAAASDDVAGTVFTIRLPRHAPAE